MFPGILLLRLFSKMKSVSAIIIICIISFNTTCWGYDFIETGVIFEEQNNPGTVSYFFGFLFTFYSTFISPVNDTECVFHPTCSRYAREAISKYGFISAYPLITARIMRCNPSAYGKGYYPAAKRSDDIWKAYDPVP
jgi:uncharacterized protein